MFGGNELIYAGTEILVSAGTSAAANKALAASAIKEATTAAREAETASSGAKIASAEARADFYVKPNGELVPSTGYRYMPSDARYLEELKATKVIPPRETGTYFSFDKYDVANPGALQVPHDAVYRGTFDTLQVIDDVRVPYGEWGEGSHLEPLTKDFPEYGLGGATQVITSKQIVLDGITRLPQK